MKNLVVAMVIASVALLFLSGASPVYAQGFSSILEKLDKLETRLQGLEKQVANVPESNTDISGIQANLNELENKISELQSGRDLTFIENSIVELTMQVRKLEDEYVYANVDGSDSKYNAEQVSTLHKITRDLKEAVVDITEVTEKQPRTTAAVDKTPKIAGMLRSFWVYDVKETSENQNYFKVNNMFVGIKGDLSEDISYNFLIDFTRSGADIILNGFVAFKPTLWSKVTVGQFLTPYSTMSLRATSKQWFISRPLISSKIFPSLRDIGVAFNTTSGNYSTTVGVFNGSGMNKVDGNLAKNLVGRMIYKLSPQLNLSGNIIYGKTNAVDSLTEDLKMYDGGISYSHHNLMLEGEYGYCETESEIKTGFFVDALYTLPTEGIIKSITPGIRYDWYDPSNDISSDVQKRYTAGVKVVFAKFPRMHLRADYQYNEIENSETNDNKLLTEMQITF